MNFMLIVTVIWHDAMTCSNITPYLCIWMWKLASIRFAGQFFAKITQIVGIYNEKYRGTHLYAEWYKNLSKIMPYIPSWYYTYFCLHTDRIPSYIFFCNNHLYYPIDTSTCTDHLSCILPTVDQKRTCWCSLWHSRTL